MTINAFNNVFLVICILTLSTIPSGVSCDGGVQEQEPVIEQSVNMFNNITLENFDQITKEKDIMLILFYVPW